MVKKENKWQQPRHYRKREQVTMSAKQRKRIKDKSFNAVLTKWIPGYEKKGECHYQNPGDNIKATPSRRPNFILKTSDRQQTKKLSNRKRRGGKRRHQGDTEPCPNSYTFNFGYRQKQGFQTESDAKGKHITYQEC
jgi:hypothetical protein